MTALSTTHPGLRIRVLDAEGDLGLTMLLDERADLAIAVEYRGGPDAADRRITLQPLYAEPFDLVLPPGHQSPADLAELADDTWIGPYPGNPVHEVITTACEKAGFTPKFAHSSDDFRAVVALVGAGAGVALVPRLALRDMALTGVAIHQLPGAERRVFAAVRRGAETHPLLRSLLSTLAS